MIGEPHPICLSVFARSDSLATLYRLLPVDVPGCAHESEPLVRADHRSPLQEFGALKVRCLT